ncbi:RICIN domain-containing protein [Nonomuraea angiospora]|uniref:RICIN domain-containing protein n=1 Tax=Nonomuraea angiospora TaxID=46172 RepID=UPI001789EFB1
MGCWCGGRRRTVPARSSSKTATPTGARRSAWQAARTWPPAWRCAGGGCSPRSISPSTCTKNPNSGRCLDVKGGSSADATPVHIWDCYGGANQKWVLP